MMATKAKYPDPKPAPFAIGQRVRYIGPPFEMQAADGWKHLDTGDVGECVATLKGYKGGAFLGYDEDDGSPDYARTCHDRSRVRFPNGIEQTFDAECEYFEAR